MTWFTLNPVSIDTRYERRPGDGWTDWRSSSSLGSAVASGSWSWSSERPAQPTQPTQPRPERRFTNASGARLHAPADVLEHMAAVADVMGRDECDIWEEAAREWLTRHAPGGAANGSGRVEASRQMESALSARRSRVWRDIDGVLDGLRDAALTIESTRISA